MDPWMFSLQARAARMGWGQLPAHPPLQDAQRDPTERMAHLCRELLLDAQETAEMAIAPLAGRVVQEPMELEPWSSPSSVLLAGEDPVWQEDGGEDAEPSSPTQQSPASPEGILGDQRPVGQIVPRIRWADPVIDEAFWVAFAKIHADECRPAKPCFWEAVTMEMEQALPPEWQRHLQGVLRRRLVCTHFNNLRRFRSPEEMDERLSQIQSALGLPRKSLWMEQELFATAGPRRSERAHQPPEAPDEPARQSRSTARSVRSRRSPDWR
jgi:hypothetical protein